MRTHTLLAVISALGAVLFVASLTRSGLATPIATRGRVAPSGFIRPSTGRITRVNSAVLDAPVRREALATAKGGRKTAHAKCAVFPGSGQIKINDKEVSDYFKHNLPAYMEMYQLLYLLGLHSEHDVEFRVDGGGMTGQKDALKLAAARLLLKEDFPLSSALPKDQLKAMLKEKGLLTRDARRKERKKYGLKKARKAPQFSKR